MSYLILTLRRRAAVVVAVAVAFAGLGVPGPGQRPVEAQEECDAQCWAVLYYLTQQGLTTEEIEDLDESGLPPAEPAPTVTTTAPPATTTTVPTVWQPTTTTTPPSDPVGGGECDPTTTWACDEVNAGIQSGYLPDDFNPHQPANTESLEQIIEDYGAQNPAFDGDAALLALQNAGDEADRGEMFNAIAAGLGIPYNPDDPFEVADELADLGILYGHDRDGDGEANPYTRPDADPDSVMSNAALAALLDRIQDDTGGGPVVDQPSGGSGPGGGATGGTTSPSRPVDPADVCTTGVALTFSERTLFAGHLRWETLAGIEPQGEPGVPWPPHPDVPGGTEWLVVSQSPVWPVVNPAARWETVDLDDGCVWVATGVQTRITQILPWQPSHRRTVEDASAARPNAGFDVYLQRWDNLSRDRQADVQRSHRNRDVSVTCPFETAKVSEDSYTQCRWELPVSGVWAWQARACFEADTGHAILRDCTTLASGVEWFLGIIDYTSGITLQAGPATGAAHPPRRPAPVG